MEGEVSRQPEQPELEAEIVRLQRSIDRYQLALMEKVAIIERLEHDLADLTGSASWLLAQRLEKFGAIIARPGSARRILLRSVWRGLKTIPRLRNRQYALDLIRNARIWAERRSSPGGSGPPRASNDSDRAGSSRIDFAIPDRIDTSIVVLAGGQPGDLWELLNSIQRSATRRNYEVIVVDSATHGDFWWAISGAQHLSVEPAASVAERWRQGARQARGKFLVFLRDDILLTSGWLDALAATFDAIPSVGLVGPKIVRADGRLARAGDPGIASGGGDDCAILDHGDHPRHNLARVVDQLWASCLMIRRSFFSELDGLGSPIANEVELAKRVREAGYKLVYQPRAKLVQPDHSRLSSISSHPPNRPHFDLRAEAGSRDDRRVSGRVLVIDHRLPTPDRDCGSLRMMEIMLGILRRGHHVTLLPDTMVVFEPYLADLQDRGIEVPCPPFTPTIADYLEQHGAEFDLVILSRADVANRHLAAVREFAPRARVVFDTVDLHFIREQRRAEIDGRRELSAAAIERKRQELGLTRAVDLTLVVSAIEKELLEAECDHEIEVRLMPTIYPVIKGRPREFEGRKDILFIGGFDHAPNVDAVLYFAREIFPRVLEKIPGAKFKVIGPDPTMEVRALESANIEILGFVPEVDPIFDRVRVSVAPIRYGAGVKGKVNQSMALGVPVVVTSIAAEGMYLVHEQSAMIADDPASFADAVVRLYTSRALWESVSANGLQNLRDHFSVEAAARPIDELLEWAGLSVAVDGMSAIR
jgi:glycosyltransferase involved in cell wall biosynthesis